MAIQEKSVIKSYVQTFIDTVVEQGIGLDQLLDGVALQESDLAKPNFRLELNTMTKLWSRAVKLTKNPLLGLHVGENVQIGSLHAFGPVAMNCPTLGIAINYMVQYYSVVSEGGELTQEHSDDCCSIRYVSDSSGLPLTQYQVEGVFSTLLHIGRLLTASKYSPVSVHFTHQPLVSLDNEGKEYERIFGCPVFFGSSFNEVKISLSDLNLPVKFADPSLLDFHESLAQKIVYSLSKSDDITHQVKQIIHETGAAFCTPDLVAKRLNKSLRSIQRKLQESHSSYQEILDLYRKEQSKHLLTQTKWPIADIAEHLGYLNLSSFYRAFQRWYEVSPAQLRKSGAHL